MRFCRPTGEYDTISPRRLGHYLRRDRWIQPAGLRTLATAINGGVIGGRGHATQRDACEAIAASPAAVIYLDPPYPGTTGYGAYGLLDTLLGDDLPAAPPPRLADLLDAAVAAPIVVLSYGGPGVTLTDVTAQVARHRQVASARAIPYPRLSSRRSRSFVARRPSVTCHLTPSASTSTRGMRWRYLLSTRFSQRSGGSLTWLSAETMKSLFAAPGVATRGQPSWPGVAARFSVSE